MRPSLVGAVLAPLNAFSLALADGMLRRALPRQDPGAGLCSPALRHARCLPRAG